MRNCHLLFSIFLSRTQISREAFEFIHFNPMLNRLNEQILFLFSSKSLAAMLKSSFITSNRLQLVVCSASHKQDSVYIQVHNLLSAQLMLKGLQKVASGNVINFNLNIKYSETTIDHQYDNSVSFT